MAEFDEYGNPSEFLKIVGKLKGNQENLKSQIHHKKRSLKDLENENEEKKEKIREMKESIEIREDSINYNNMMYENLNSQLRSAQETDQLLRSQVIVAKENYELEKEENNQLITRCKEIYRTFEEKLQNRRKYYEANRPLAKIIHDKKLEITSADKMLQETKRAIKQLEDEHTQLLQLKNEPEKSLTEWGVNLAMMMVELNKRNIKDDLQLNKSLLGENEELKEKKIQKIKIHDLKLESQKGLFKMPQTFARKTIAKPQTNLANKSDYFFKTESVPSFKSFFKDKLPRPQNAIQSQGSSGLLCGMATSMPNIANINAKDQAILSIVQKSPLKETNLQRSNSLFSLSPKNNQESGGLENKSKQSLSDWLNGTNVKNNHASSEAPIIEIKQTQKYDQRIAEKAEKLQEPLNSEASLCRKAHKNTFNHNHVEDDNSNMDVDTNLLNLYDGKVYEQKVKQDGDENASNTPKSFQSPKSDFGSMPADHQKIMSQFLESPEHGFIFEPHVVHMEGADQSYLMSPDARKDDFQFKLSQQNNDQPNFNFNQSFNNFEQSQPEFSRNSSPGSGFSFKFEMPTDSNKNEVFTFGAAKEEENLFSDFGSSKNENNPFSFNSSSTAINKECSFSSMFGFGK